MSDPLSALLTGASGASQGANALSTASSIVSNPLVQAGSLALGPIGPLLLGGAGLALDFFEAEDRKKEEERLRKEREQKAAWSNLINVAGGSSGF